MGGKVWRGKMREGRVGGEKGRVGGEKGRVGERRGG